LISLDSARLDTVLILTPLLFFESIASKYIITEEVDLRVVVCFGIISVDRIKHWRLARLSENRNNAKVAFAPPGRWKFLPVDRNSLKTKFCIIAVVI
jgi:hypothetical protein